MEELQGEAEVACPMSGIWEELTKGSLVTHCQTQHGVDKGGLESEAGGEDEFNDPST